MYNTFPQMSAIYVLSDSANPGRFKVGSHTGKLEKLKSRYITAIPTLIIHYFIETPDAIKAENKFKQMHIKERIKNTNGNLCEWVNMELHEIIGSLLAILLRCVNSKNKETIVISDFKCDEKNISKLNPPQKIPIEDDNPAINYNQEEKISGTDSSPKNILIEDDRPTEVWKDGTRFWHREEKLHRDNDKPAMICSDGSQAWYWVSRMV